MAMTDKQQDTRHSPVLAVTIAGVDFKNPVIAASGTFGFGREYAKVFPLSELGGIALKGTSLKPRPGNPTPRVAETPSGMLNCIGLQNPGVDYFLRNELPFLEKQGTRLISNIAGDTAEDYAAVAERLSGTSIDMIELNISCPNVKTGGMAFGVTCAGAAEVTKAVRAATKKPLCVKLSPNVTDIVSIAQAVEDAGADAVSLINTLLGMRIDIATRRPILANNVGGLSGPAVFPVALRCVWQVAKAVQIPVIGMGGIATWEDAVQMFLAGASAIQVGTATFTDPYAMLHIRDGLSAYLADQHIKNISELTGQVRPY
ncbi:dihydroorotate dehydrogenase [Ethanoligenens sp.]|uniref:dihydroorotate dehydrogenase n=1 Tax=Ethanoligenens sp. TaxID=2099655 RepID=UPI0039EADDD7